MTPEERAAAEAALNLFLAQAFQTVVIVFALQYFARKGWRRLGMPDLRPWLTWLVSRVSTTLQTFEKSPTAPPNLTERAEPANERTNEPTRTPRTVLYKAADLLLVDRTRPAVIAVLVAAGWKTTDIRGMLKGTAEDIGAEVKAAQEAEPPPRTLVVDGKRTIAL